MNELSPESSQLFTSVGEGVGIVSRAVLCLPENGCGHRLIASFVDCLGSRTSPFIRRGGYNTPGVCGG
jgi:hypothetical protein